MLVVLPCHTFHCVIVAPCVSRRTLVYVWRNYASLYTFGRADIDRSGVCACSGGVAMFVLVLVVLVLVAVTIVVHRQAAHPSVVHTCPQPQLLQLKWSDLIWNDTPSNLKTGIPNVIGVHFRPAKSTRRECASCLATFVSSPIMPHHALSLVFVCFVLCLVTLQHKFTTSCTVP